jgi:hypothetical protein
VAIAVVAVGTVVTATTAAVNAPLPVGWAPGHLHVLVIETENEPIPVMSGWSNVGAGVQNVAGGTITALTIRYRVAQSGDTAPSVPASTGAAAGKHTIARIIGFSGVDTTTPWDVTLFGSESVSDTTVSFPDITTTTANCMIVHVFSTGQDTTTAQSSGAGTNANLTGLTNRMNNWTNAGGGGGFAMITGLKATAGAIGTTTTTLTTANFKALFSGALREAAAPPAAPQRPHFNYSAAVSRSYTW